VHVALKTKEVAALCKRQTEYRGLVVLSKLSETGIPTAVVSNRGARIAIR
jgi:hypothetical protein